MVAHTLKIGDMSKQHDTEGTHPDEGGESDMVEMTIRMQIRPSKHKELLQTLDDLRRVKRQEKGFLDSLIVTSNGDHDTLTFIEQWQTQTDLDAYLQSYYFSVLRGAIKLLTVTSEVAFRTTKGGGSLHRR
jgi:quinol monooxygenase YgiN